MCSNIENLPKYSYLDINRKKNAFSLLLKKVNTTGIIYIKKINKTTINVEYFDH